MHRSTIDQLPPEIRKWLAERLYHGGFCNYSGIHAELKKKGYECSRTAIWRWGRKLEQAVRKEQIQALTHPAA